MSRKPLPDLSRRERQLMDAIYVLGEASVAEVLGELPDPPSYSTVRALLTILVEKGHLKFRAVEGRYVYSPTRKRLRAGRTALKQVLDTFFEGSLKQAVAALLNEGDARLSASELAELAQLIRQTEKEEP